MVASRLRSHAGQATTEWLMIAGVFMTFVLLLYRLVPAAIRTYSTELMYSINGVWP
jgi:hypothetical protein